MIIILMTHLSVFLCTVQHFDDISGEDNVLRQITSAVYAYKHKRTSRMIYNFFLPLVRVYMVKLCNNLN